MSLQKQAGNQAMLRTILPATTSPEEEVDSASTAVEKIPQNKQHPSQLSPRNLRKRLDSLTNQESDWELLLGGDDPPAAPSQVPHKKRMRRRGTRWLTTHSENDSALKDSENPSPAPQRPLHAQKGHRLFYALDASLYSPSQWVNPDTLIPSLKIL